MGTSLYTANFTSNDHPERKGKLICAEWMEDQAYGAGMGQLFSILVSVINVVFKMITFPLVNSLRLHTVTNANKFMMLTVFFLTFFYSAI